MIRHGSQRSELGGRRRPRRAGRVAPRRPQRRAVPAGGGERVRVALVGDDEPRAARPSSRSRRSFGRSCSVHGSTTKPGGSRRPSSAPTPAGCRAASGRRRRAPRRARPARRPARGRPRRPRPSSTRAARRRARASTSARRPAVPASTTSRAKFIAASVRGNRRVRAHRGVMLGSMAVATSPFEKTDEQKAIIEMVRQFVDEQIIPKAEHYDGADEYPEPIVEQMKELGLFGVTIPEEYGGMGLDLTTYTMIVEELIARLDLDLRRRQHPLHRLLPADEVRHRRAEGAAAAAHGDRRDPRRVLAVRARARLRRPGDQVDRHEDGRRRLRDQRPEDVGHERPHVRRRLRPRQDRPRRRARPTRA